MVFKHWQSSYLDFLLVTTSWRSFSCFSTQGIRALMVKSRTSIRTRSISLGLKIHMKCLESFTKCRLISCSGPEEFSNWCRSGLGEPWHWSRVTGWERFWTRIGQRMGGLLEIQWENKTFDESFGTNLSLLRIACFLLPWVLRWPGWISVTPL